jgi:hypothetical protein
VFFQVLAMKKWNVIPMKMERHPDGWAQKTGV